MRKRVGLPTQITEAELRSLVADSSAVLYSGSTNFDSNYLSSASFLYEPSSMGLKSSQQLKVDWSRFENHTFFNSAEVKVNVAFDKIVNTFPFDGTKKEVERFFDSLTGYEKWVYDNWPKNVGYLNFNRAAESYVSVQDAAGTVVPNASRDKTARNYLDIGSSPITLEMQVHIPDVANVTPAVIVQKHDDVLNQGFTIHQSDIAVDGYTMVSFSLYSGSANINVSGSFKKGQFNHLAAVYDKNDTNRLLLYRNGKLLSVSDTAREFDSISTAGQPLLIGSGTKFSTTGGVVNIDTTFSGSIDEFRYWKMAKSPFEIEKFKTKNVFQSDELALYYKFNEPTGSLSGDETSTINRVVLDSSGKSMHGYINASGFSFDLRSTGSIEVPLANERTLLNPVLFPAYTEVSDFNTELLLSASGYDAGNPNIITKLIPNHYLQEGQAQEGLESEDGSIKDSYTGNAEPGSGKIGSTQLLLALLYSTAKFFDELKLMIDAFKDSNYVCYDQFDTAPDNFLPMVLKEYGFNVPNLFSDSAFDQYNDAENITAGYGISKNPLKDVQNQLLRRLLSSITSIVQSKGTLHSIKSFFRTIGVNPDASIRIKEYGGPTQRTLDTIRDNKFVVASSLDFVSGGLVQSPFLSASRIEKGSPEAVGPFVHKPGTGFHGVSSNRSDGLLTSGSWTFESWYRWPHSTHAHTTQSLVRFSTIDSTSQNNLQMNLLLLSGANSGTLRLYARSDGYSTAPTTTLSLDGPFFNGSPWHFTVGRSRNDITGSVSSSYVLRAIQTDYGDVRNLFTTASRYQELVSSSSWQKLLTSNASGSRFSIGYDPTASSATLYLNDTGIDAEARETNFNGQILQTRFWSKLLTEQESLEHALSLKSNGVLDPKTNYNFVTAQSGAWQRLRLDATFDQETKTTDSSGDIQFFDYSQSNRHLTGTSFPVSKQVINPVLWNDGAISAQIDEAVTSNKTRIRSFLDEKNVEQEVGSKLGPLYSLDPTLQPTDDTRFSIEFSLVDALNQDIVNIFATLDALDNALGDPTNSFDDGYKGIDDLRNIYFERLTDNLNFKSFFEFFRWFDTSIGTFVDQLLPKKTKYLGTNFVVESHMLERHSKRYLNDDMYYAEDVKPRIEDRILLQQIVGTMRKF